MRYNRHGFALPAMLAGALAVPKAGQSIDVLDSIEGFSLADFTEYVRNVNPFESTDALLGDVLFPVERVEELTVRSLIGANGAAVMADVTSHLGEAPIVGRRIVGSVEVPIPAIKQKRLLDAATLIKLQTQRGAVLDAAINEIFDDATAVRRGVRSTGEYLRMQVLAYGIATLDWVGAQGAIDYRVPAGHKEILAGTDLWSDPANSDPVGDLRRWVNIVVGDTGERPLVAVTSSTVTKAVVSNQNIRGAMDGVNVDGMATLAEVNAFLQAQQLPTFVQYDRMARRLAADGTETNVRFYPENRVTLIPGLGRIGRLLAAPTPQEGLPAGTAPGRLAIDGDRIAVHTYLSSMDPVGLMTLGIASHFPSFEFADRTFHAQVI